MQPALWRIALFIGIAYGYLGNLNGIWPWLAIATIANGMEYVRQTVILWAAEEANRD